jgi:hypothetical protein
VRLSTNSPAVVGIEILLDNEQDDQRYLLVVFHCPTPDGAHWGSPNHAEREVGVKA